MYETPLFGYTECKLKGEFFYAYRQNRTDTDDYRRSELRTDRHFQARSGRAAVRRTDRRHQPHRLHSGRTGGSMVYLAALPTG